MKQLLFIVTSAGIIGTGNVKTGYEFSEIADPYIELIKVGYTIDFASIRGGVPPGEGYDDTHHNSRLFRNSPGFEKLKSSYQLKHVSVDDYAGIFFPGGLGPMVDMVDNQLIKEVISNVYEKGKIVAAVCHGPVAFLNVSLSNGKYLLEGKRVTCFTEAEEKIKKHHLHTVIPFMLSDALKRQGAVFSSGKPFENYVVVDANLITGQNPGSAVNVAREIVRAHHHAIAGS